MRTSASILAAFLVAGATAFAQPQAPAKKPTAAPTAPAARPAAVSATATPTQEDLRAAAGIREDIRELTKQLEASTAENEKYTGGLIKARIESRISVIRYTIAMLDQRARALELGAKIVPVEVRTTAAEPDTVRQIDAEIAASNERLAEIKNRASRYSGGLILAQIESTAATVSETIALLEQRKAVAKYGIVVGERKSEAAPAAIASASTAASTKAAAAGKAAPLQDTIILVRLSSKNYNEYKYDKSIFFSGDYVAEGLDRPARSIKGIFKVQDLFGETKVPIGWTLTQAIAPGQSQSFSGKGIEYNQFKNAHQWLRSTEVNDLKVVFTVESIIYEDGTRRDF